MRNSPIFQSNNQVSAVYNAIQFIDGDIERPPQTEIDHFEYESERFGYPERLTNWTEAINQNYTKTTPEGRARAGFLPDNRNNHPRLRCSFWRRFLEGLGLLYKMWPLKGFLYGDVHIILKRKNLKICAHSIFVQLLNKNTFNGTFNIRFWLMLVGEKNLVFWFN